MFATIIWQDLSQAEKRQCLKRPVQDNHVDVSSKVGEIIAEVKLHGDLALQKMTQLFDRVMIKQIKISQQEFQLARARIKARTRTAMLRIHQHLLAFHEPQKLLDIAVETSPGVICESLTRPVESVGLYIPNGSAPLVSTVLMLGVPAKIAGCPTRILCSPPDKNGEIEPHILLAAEICGIDHVYKCGGAQAIAAMAYGTASIPKVDKIFGPGNAWVTEAKRQVAQDPAGALYDLPAGPSEVMVIADNTGNPEFIAADLLSQAEHGADSQVMFICTDNNLIHQVFEAIERQIKNLSRHAIIHRSLQMSRFILVENLTTAIALANSYAPEHLIMQVKNPRHYLNEIKHAGSVFLGHWSPESAGDYASGTNHVLPTYGFARGLSGLTVRDFMKTISVQELTKEGLKALAETIQELTAIEGLDAHQQAIDIRLRSDND